MTDPSERAQPAGRSGPSESPPPPDTEPAAASPAERTDPTEPAARPAEPRPWLERIGLAAIAAVMGGLFALVAVATFVGGEWVLAAMAAVGALMTFAVGLSTLIRG